VPGIAWAFVYANDVSGGKIFGVPFGGSTSTLLAMGGNMGTQLTFDSTSIYYSLESSDDAGLPEYALGSLPIAGGTQSTVAAPSPSTIEGIASDGHSIYVLKDDSNSTGGTPIFHGVIEAIPLGSGAPVTLQTVSEQPTGVAVDSQYVYWTQTPAVSLMGTQAMGSVHRVPLAGGTDETLATGQLDPVAVAVDASGIYWINRGTPGIDCTSTDGSLVRIARGSTSPVTLASGLQGPGALTARSGNAYFATAGSFCNVGGNGLGSVHKYASASGQTTVVASGVTGPQNLYADGTYLYFTVFTDPLNGVLAAMSVPM
jgi:hypothetical protein